jgi:hypothetical protein
MPMAKGGSIVSVSAGDRIGDSFSPGMKTARRAPPAVTRGGRSSLWPSLGRQAQKNFSPFSGKIIKYHPPFTLRGFPRESQGLPIATQPTTMNTSRTHPRTRKPSLILVGSLAALLGAPLALSTPFTGSAPPMGILMPITGRTPPAQRWFQD